MALAGARGERSQADEDADQEQQSAEHRRKVGGAHARGAPQVVRAREDDEQRAEYGKQDPGPEVLGISDLHESALPAQSTRAPENLTTFSYLESSARTSSAN